MQSLSIYFFRELSTEGQIKSGTERKPEEIKHTLVGLSVIPSDPLLQRDTFAFLMKSIQRARSQASCIEIYFKRYNGPALPKAYTEKIILTLTDSKTLFDNNLIAIFLSLRRAGVWTLLEVPINS